MLHSQRNMRASMRAGRSIRHLQRVAEEPCIRLSARGMFSGFKGVVE